VAESAIGIDDARRTVIEGLAPLGAEDVELDRALGRRLGADAVATAPVQGFDNSSMDGYALRAADTAGATPESPVGLRVVGESRAGHPADTEVGAGEAIAISTGAMLPDGADAVARLEDTTAEGEAVLVAVEATPGENVRLAGEDFALGDTVLRAGLVIGPAELGVLAALDLESVPCVRRPRIAIVTSGDELTPPGVPLRPGAIRDSNSRTLPALAESAGAAVVSVGWAPDDPAATRDALEPALEADVAVVCGGVSVGTHDHVKAALAELGVEQVFWRVALKPGGPTWFGRRGETLVFGLPGNPAMVTFLLLVRPALLALGGGEPTSRRTRATLATDYEKPAGRAHAVRCALELTEAGWRAHPHPRQGSNVLTSMVAADCLALIPAAVTRVGAGETVEIELLDGAAAAPSGASIER
jgi:molybdopterin molybdotransferase